MSETHVGLTDRELDAILSRDEAERSDAAAEFRRPRRRAYRCADRMCGAADCINCHAENFRGGVYVEDAE